MKLQDTKAGWYLSLSEGRLGLIHIDFQLKLDLIDSSGTTNLTIEAQFHLKKANLDMVLSDWNFAVAAS